MNFLLFVLICVPPNNPITASGATSFPGYHSFPKWAIVFRHTSENRSKKVHINQGFFWIRNINIPVDTWQVFLLPPCTRKENKQPIMLFLAWNENCVISNIVVCNVIECIGKVYFTVKNLKNKILKLGVEFKN